MAGASARWASAVFALGAALAACDTLVIRFPAAGADACVPGSSSAGVCEVCGSRPAEGCEAVIDFGVVSSLTVSGPRTLKVRNAGRAAAQVTLSASDSGGPFDWSTSSCRDATLAGSGTCELAATFAPTKTGTFATTLSVTLGTSTASVRLRGEARAASGSSIEPSTHDFGAVLVGQTSAQRSFVVASADATGPVRVSLEGNSPKEFAVTADACSGPAVPTTCSVSLAFQPLVRGVRRAILKVSAGPTVLTATIQGTGDGSLLPLLEAVPSPLAFGSVAVGTSSMRSITLTNTGGGASDVPSIEILGAALNDFVAGAGTCLSPLAPGATCVLQVTFTPSALGERAAILELDYAQQRLSIDLSGAGS